MSTTIDEKVVSMKFDNKDFESNVKTSMSTLDKLKNALTFKGAEKGLQNVSKAANSIDFSKSEIAATRAGFHIQDVFEKVTRYIENNIASRITNTLTNVAKDFTITPLTTGFNEYELKMGSVQTIMAATGESIDTVNGYLEELNKYSDQTIYSFADMTSNISKFTNAGVSLDDSVAAIKGVSNAAALAGADANEASRAMYNLAQSLSAGYVKLIDWKSIENANMATVQFKNQLLEAAVAAGTLTKAEDGYYKTAKGTMINATHEFNDSLQEQWMTSEVLVATLRDYADANTEIGKKAYAAAQDVKTFSMMMDTLKEAAQSGWAQTWEILFGNLEEAKKLWTGLSNYFGDIIGKSADARNQLLQGWKDAGGKAMLFEGLKRAFQALLDVIKPIKEAFREIFPPTTVEQLNNLSYKFLMFTTRLKISEKTSEKLKSTFKGLFAIISILKQAFEAVAGGIGRIIGTFASFSSGVLGVTGSIGDWIVALDAFLKKHDVFKTAVNGVIDFILSIPAAMSSAFEAITGITIGDVFDGIKEKITAAIEGIKQAFNNFSTIDTSGVDNFTNSVKSKFDPIVSIFEGFKKVMGGLWEFLKKLSPLFLSVASLFGKALGAIGDAVTGAVSNASFENVLNIINSGILLSISGGIKNFVNTLTDFPTDILDNIKGIFGGLKDCITSFQEGIKAKTLKTIAIAIGILAASLFVLSTIPQDKLEMGLAAITGLFGELMGSMAIFSKIISSSGFTAMPKISGAMIAMAASVFILASAMKMLAGLSWDEVFKGLVAVGVLCVEVAESAKLLSANKGKMMKGATGLIAFALAVKMLVKPVKELGQLDASSLKKGLIGLGVVCVELAAFVRLLDGEKMKTGTGVALIALAAAVKILASAVGSFGSMNSESLVKGLSALTIVLYELQEFTKTTKDTENVISTAIGLTILGAAMNILAKAIASMGSLSVEQIAKGLVAMGGALFIIEEALNAMPEKGVFSASVGLVLVGAALNEIAVALKGFGGMSLEDICKGLIAMGGALFELSIALNLMEGTLGGSFALLVAATGLAILAPVLKSFGKMSLKQIGKSLLTLAGALAIIGAAGYLLAPVVPALLGLGGAIALIGVGALACGAGILMLSAGLAALAVSGTAGATALVLIAESLIGLIPTIAVNLAKSVVSFVEAIGSMAPALAEAFVNVVLAAITALDQTVPALLQFAGNMLTSLMQTLVEFGPGIIEAGFTLIMGFIQVIADNIGQLTGIAIDAILNMLAAIGEKMPDIVQAGFDLVINFIEGFGQGLVDNAPALRDALLGLCADILEAILAFFGIHSPSTVFADIGKNLILGLIEGIKGMLEALWELILSIPATVISLIGTFAGRLVDLGKQFITWIIDGIKSAAVNLWDAVKGVVEGAVDGVIDFIDHKEVSAVDDLSLRYFDPDRWKELASKTGEEAGKALNDDINDSAPDGKTMGETFVNDYSTALSDGKTQVKTSLGEIMEEHNAELAKNYANANLNGREWMSSLDEGMESGKPALKTTANQISASTYGALNDTAPQFKTSGRYMMDGLATGINNNKSTAINAAATAALQALKAANDALGIKSPSREFIKTGMYSDQGFAIGLEKYSSVIVDSSRRVGKTALDAMSESIANISKIIDTDVDLNPTIKPVMDLSDVTNGANAISSLLNRQSTVGVMANVKSISSSMNSRQNGKDPVVSAIDALGNKVASTNGNVYNVNGITYDDGSNISEAVRMLIRATRIEGRV